MYNNCLFALGTCRTPSSPCLAPCAMAQPSKVKLTQFFALSCPTVEKQLCYHSTEADDCFLFPSIGTLSAVKRLSLFEMFHNREETLNSFAFLWVNRSLWNAFHEVRSWCDSVKEFTETGIWCSAFRSCVAILKSLKLLANPEPTGAVTQKRPRTLKRQKGDTRQKRGRVSKQQKQKTLRVARHVRTSCQRKENRHRESKQHLL